MTARTCGATKKDGERCRMPPLRDSEYCIAHAPEHAREMAEARRLGGLRRRRERTLAGAYEIEGLASVAQLQRVLTIVMMDLLGLDNSLGRARSLIAVVGMAAKLLEVQANHPEEGQEYERAVIGPDGVARVLLPGGRTKVVDPVEAEFTT